MYYSDVTVTVCLDSCLSVCFTLYLTLQSDMHYKTAQPVSFYVNKSYYSLFRIPFTNLEVLV